MFFKRIFIIVLTAQTLLSSVWCQDPPKQAKPDGLRGVVWLAKPPVEVQQQYESALNTAVGMINFDQPLIARTREANIRYVPTTDIRADYASVIGTSVPENFSLDSFTAIMQETIADEPLEIHYVYLDQSVFLSMAQLIIAINHELFHIALWHEGKRFEQRSTEEVAVFRSSIESIRNKVIEGIVKNIGERNKTVTDLKSLLEKEQIKLKAWLDSEV